jgi:hypothetical protein
MEIVDWCALCTTANVVENLVLQVLLFYMADVFYKFLGRAA